jgi:hypothetical protein
MDHSGPWIQPHPDTGEPASVWNGVHVTLRETPHAHDCPDLRHEGERTWACDEPRCLLSPLATCPVHQPLVSHQLCRCGCGVRGRPVG